MSVPGGNCMKLRWRLNTVKVFASLLLIGAAIEIGGALYPNVSGKKARLEAERELKRISCELKLDELRAYGHIMRLKSEMARDRGHYVDAIKLEQESDNSMSLQLTDLAKLQGQFQDLSAQLEALGSNFSIGIGMGLFCCSVVLYALSLVMRSHLKKDPDEGTTSSDPRAPAQTAPPP
jgi:hypothetical protein